MDFIVNDTNFNGEIILDDIIEVKSFNKNYKVFYSEKNVDELVNENYCENDIIFIDRNVYNLSLKKFENMIDNIIIFDAIEDNKNIDSALNVVDKLYEKNFTKKNKLIVIGGGITQDVGGFIAGIYKRGIDWILIPTTLLSMTDSCIGAKVSINRNSKNMLGIFIAPNKVIISVFFLKSLEKDDILSGLSESLKLSLIGGIETYNFFKEKFNQDDYINIIKMSSLVKKIIIEKDEFEKNERKVLNYGHTIGHALESTTNYFIPHGIAICIGMYIINELFYENKYKEINNLIKEKIVNSKFFDIKLDFEKLIVHILSDKKNDGNKVCFIVLDEIGKSKFIYVEINEIKDKLKSILNDLFTEVI